MSNVAVLNKAPISCNPRRSFVKNIFSEKKYRDHSTANGEIIWTIRLAVVTQYRIVTDMRPCGGIYALYAEHRAV